LVYSGIRWSIRTRRNSLRKNFSVKAEQIVSAFVAKYGKVILAAPPAEGFDLVAWTLPFIMLLFGFIVVYWLINTWLIRKPALVSSAGGRDAIPEGYQDRIDRELKDLDR